MTSLTRRTAVSLAVAFVLSGQLRAHHGDIGRFGRDVSTIEGTVVEIRLIDPHSIILTAVVESGKKVRWQAELDSPLQLRKRFGWTRSTLKPGDRVTLIGRRALSGIPYLSLTSRAAVVLTGSGKALFRSPDFGLPTGEATAPRR
jgi:hypothetical protein